MLNSGHYRVRVMFSKMTESVTCSLDGQGLNWNHKIKVGLVKT